MSYNNLPTVIQSVIQPNMLRREFEESLHAKLGFRDIADREDFPARIGQTLTSTRPSLLPTFENPIGVRSNRDLDDGLTDVQWAVEQYTLNVQQYMQTMSVQAASSAEAIVKIYLQNARSLAESAARTVDKLALKALMSAAFAGNTFVTVALGSASSTLKVDDLGGFLLAPNSGNPGVMQAVGTSYNGVLTTVLVTIGNDVYTVIGAVADATNVSTMIALGGVSGTLTLSSAVSVADGAAGSAVVAQSASAILRPNGANSMAGLATLPSGTVNTLTIADVLALRSLMDANGVPPLADGLFRLYADPLAMKGLYADPVFQSYFRGSHDSEEYRRGVIAELMGVQLRVTNMNPTVTTNFGTVRHSFMVGKGVLVEGVFNNAVYNEMDMDGPSDIERVDDIYHITREPLNRAQDVVTQTTVYTGGFVAPTDSLTTPAVLPTATYANYKRIATIQSL